MKRPLSVTIAGWVFILTGAVGFFYHFAEIKWANLFSNDAILIELIRLVAVVGGILTLRGSNIGRIIVVVWMVYHVALSIYHPIEQLIMHVIILILIIGALFNAKANRFFVRQ